MQNETVEQLLNKSEEIIFMEHPQASGQGSV
jgi:hypothetical protein